MTSSLIHEWKNIKMEQLAATNETNRLLALILTELKTSNEMARKQVASAAVSVTIGENIMAMIRKWALEQATAMTFVSAVHL